MLISEIMSRNVVCIGPDASLQEAASRMRALNVGSLPVCDNDRVIGIITDRDITIRATSECCGPAETTVREVMTEKLVYAFEDQPVEIVARLMQDNQIRRIPILNTDERLVGIVALADIATESTDEIAASTLEAISEPSFSGS
jgi:CBS domain-containing protein